MRSTFWQNRICERQSCQNRHTGPNSLQKGKTVRFSWKLYKTLFSGHAEHVLAKSHFRASKLSKWSNWPEIVLKTGKQCAFHENCTKRSFQIMRSTFWPNRIRERQSGKNCHTGLKFSPKRENSALFMKIVQLWQSSHVSFLLRSCAARFGQIAFVSVKVVKIVTLAWNSLQKGKTVRFSWKLYKTLFSGHAQHVLAKSHFWASKLSKSSHWPEILFKTGKQCVFHENCTKRSFQSCAARFGQIAFWASKFSKSSVTLAWNSPQKGKTVCFSWKLYKTLFSDHAQHVLAKSHFWASKFSKSSHLLKFSSKRENSALSMKIVQNALFRSCAARFGQIAFLSVKVLKIVTLAWNSLQKGKTVRFSWKLYKTLFSDHAQHVLAKSHFWGSNF